MKHLSEIRFDEINRINGTSWSFVQHTPTLQLFFCDDFPKDYHISVYYRPITMDIHATHILVSGKKKFKKYHHGQGLRIFNSKIFAFIVCEGDFNHV